MPKKSEILIVDDEPDIRDLIKLELEDHDYMVHQAGNGKEALSLLLLVKPDLIVTDVSMPEMDGLTFLRALCLRDRKLPPIIIMTGKTIQLDKDQNDEKIKSSLIEIIDKPFLPSTLCLAIEKALAHPKA